MSSQDAKDNAIEIRNISKRYRLGVIGHGTLYRDLQSWWAKLRGKEDPNGKLFGASECRGRQPEFFALNDISLDIHRGDIVGVIGRNGAGKSTLLKLLSRITTPTSGEIRIKGRVASLLEVGTGFHSELTGRENIYLNGAILGMTKAEIDRKFDEIVAFSELEKFIDTPVKRYSSGMTVRLAFAVAAHLESEILVVDEVLAVGDAAFRKKCIGKMQGVSREQSRTVLFVSHDMGSIRTLCNRVAVLEKGEILFDGDVEEGVKKYGEMNADETATGVFTFDYLKGKFPVNISRAALLNKNGDFTAEFHSHESMTIEIELEGEPPQGGFNLEWRLASSRGEALAFGGSYALSNKTYKKEDKIIRCEIETLPLATGSYYFTLMLRIWGQEAWNYIERAIPFDILPNPHPETGFQYEIWHAGPLNLLQKWE